MGKYQSGHEVQHTYEYSSNQCAKRCCLYTLCAGYYWERDTRRCSLTRSTGLTKPVSEKYQWCQKKLGMIFIFWYHFTYFLQEPNQICLLFSSVDHSGFLFSETSTWCYVS